MWYNVCHVGGTMYHIWGYNVSFGGTVCNQSENLRKCGSAIREFKELHLKVKTCGGLDVIFVRFEFCAENENELSH